MNETMNYGVILAGGRGTRMDSIDIPKQYYEIDGKPIFMYALLTMLNTNVFDLIYIAIHFDYLDKVKDYLSKFVSKENLSKIIITNGGKERIDSIHNVLKEISKNDISADDIICVHEAARPLVTERVLIDSIEGAKKYGAVVASVPAEDTILISDDGSVVDTIPDRKRIFREQAPESFRLKELIEYENRLSEEEKKIFTSTCQIISANNKKIRMIKGDYANFKITTNTDLDRAKLLILAKNKDQS